MPEAKASKRKTAAPASPDEQTALLAAIVESSDDAIIGKAFDGTITGWNRGAERVYGYSAAEALGRHISLIVPQERQHELLVIDSRIQRGETIRHFETVRLARDGRRIDVSISASPIRDAQGNITGIASIARDITQHKQSESALQQLKVTVDNRAVVLEAASRVALDILASRTGLEALRHIADAARTLAHARYAALGVARPDGHGLMEFATVGLTPAQEAAIGPRPKGAGI